MNKDQKRKRERVREGKREGEREGEKRKQERERKGRREEGKREGRSRRCQHVKRNLVYRGSEEKLRVRRVGGERGWQGKGSVCSCTQVILGRNA